MENELKLKTVNGEDVTIEVLDIVEGNFNGINKKYIVFSEENDSEDIMVSILNETEDSYSLDNIDSDDEFNYVQNLLIEINKGDEDE